MDTYMDIERVHYALGFPLSHKILDSARHPLPPKKNLCAPPLHGPQVASEFVCKYRMYVGICLANIK